MKTENIIGLIGTILIIILVSYLSYDYFDNQKNLKQTINNINIPINNMNETAQLTGKYISTHNKVSDCWIIISDNVYAVSNFLNAHPGGSNMIIPYCGGDATLAFATQGGDGSHSSFANNQLSGYLIGTINSTTTVNDIQQTLQNINQLTPSTSTEDEREDEEEEEDDD